MATSKKGASGRPPKRTPGGPGVSKDTDARMTRVLSTLDKQLEERFERLFVRLIWRLGLASQKDVGGLSQRIDQLERRLRSRQSKGRLKALPRRPPAAAPDENDSSSSGNSAA